MRFPGLDRITIAAAVTVDIVLGLGASMASIPEIPQLSSYLETGDIPAALACMV